jgi:hypothetical protein
MREQAPHDAPFAISSIDAATLRESGPMVNLSEALVWVPGLVASPSHAGYAAATWQCATRQSRAH